MSRTQKRKFKKCEAELVQYAQDYMDAKLFMAMYFKQPREKL